MTHPTDQPTPAGGDNWAAWLVRHGPALLLLSRQWAGGGSADAEDLVQEAFLRFWSSRGRAADPAAYLYGCLRGCAMERARGDRRRRAREASAARPASAPDALFHAAASAERDERRRLIEAALGRLPPAQREVVVMKVWGGLSFPQIAAATGVSPDTVASRHRYALAKLRGQLAAEPDP